MTTRACSCASLQFGICINDQTCQCFAGYAGPTCKDLATTLPSQISAVNIGGIVAGVLGGILFTLIVGLAIFFIWKRRVKKKESRFSPLTPTSSSSSSSSPAPIVVPALYNLSSSRRYSTATSAPTMTYHLYDELP